MSSRPTKILKISAFRDFFVTEPKCQKGAKNRVKTRFLRRISILCSSYGGSDGNLNRNVRFRQCVAFRSTVAHSFRRLSMAVRPSFPSAEWVRYPQKVPPQRRGSALCTDPLLCGGSDGNLNRNVRFRQCVAFRSTVAHSFRRLSMAVRPSFPSAEWVRYPQKVPPQRRGSALCTDPLLCGGSDGNRTHVRKPLDTTFFVGSLFFYSSRSETRADTLFLTVAPFFLTGSGATADAGSPLI